MRLLATFWRRRTGDDFGAEIEAHIALETERLISDGWPSHAAADEARRRFGNVGRVREQYYDRTHIVWFDDLARDMRYALRSLLHDKTYVLAAVGALGLGLAANIALFSLFSAVALKPLPVPAPERLVSISQVRPPVRFGPFSIADYLFYRNSSRTLGSVAIAQPAHLRLVGNGALAEPVIALFVTTNYFATFGIRPAAGRLLRADDDVGNGSFAALISDNYWQRRFARDPSVIGSTLMVSGIRAYIVGVTPHDFAGVRSEIPDLWISLSALGDIGQRATRETTACCEMVARIANGFALRDVQKELVTLAAVRRQELPASERQMTVNVSPASSFGALAETVKPLFAALQVAMFLVLFIACANVASLMLGRAAAREREMAIRLATGANRARLVRQLLTEGVIVSLAAGIFAAAVTAYALVVGARLASELLSRQGGGTLALTITADARLALYVAAVSIAAGIMFALAPALQASRADLAGSLRTLTGASSRIGMSRMRSVLIASQVALSVALLMVAAGLGRSAALLVRADPGFVARGVLSVWLTNPQELALGADRAHVIETEVRRRLGQMPGVISLAVASRVPLGGNVSTSAMLPTDRGDADAAPQYPYTFVSESFFSTLGIRLVRGRTFTAEEVRDSARVAVISDSLARAFWPGADPIGKQLAFGAARSTPFNYGPRLSGTAQVVGVVADVRGVSMTGADVGDVYLPKITNEWSSRILLRTTDNPALVVREIPRIVRAVEPTLPVSVQPMDDVVASDASVTTARVSSSILAAIGFIGLLLASVGVYGMISYTVRQKQREIGVRMALGANGVQILGATLRDTIVWVARGVVAGVALGIVGIELTNAVLAGASVSASVLDPASTLLVPGAIAALSILAAALSARKAMHTDPAVVLRSDG